MRRCPPSQIGRGPLPGIPCKCFGGGIVSEGFGTQFYSSRPPISQKFLYLSGGRDLPRADVRLLRVPLVGGHRRGEAQDDHDAVRVADGSHPAGVCTRSFGGFS